MSIYGVRKINRKKVGSILMTIQPVIRHFVNVPVIVAYALAAGVSLWHVDVTAGAAAPADASAQAATTAEALGLPDFDKQFRPLARKYCFECHNPKKKKSDLDLEAMTTPASYQRNVELLDTIAYYLEEKEMPPMKAAQPSEAERATMLKWVRGTLSIAQNMRPNDPGAVVMPRLNHNEYAFVIRDLTGQDIDVRSVLPRDGGGGEGFSNVGAVHGVNALQIEKYLVVAKKVTSHLRASPVTGFAWHGDAQLPLQTTHDRRQRIAADLLTWHQEVYTESIDNLKRELRKTLDMEDGAFWEAAWRYRYRKELGTPDATLADIAGGYDIPLPAPSLELWSKALNQDPDKQTRYVAEVLRRWQALPGPGEMDAAEVRRVCRELDEYKRKWRNLPPRKSPILERFPRDEERAAKDGLKRGVSMHRVTLRKDRRGRDIDVDTLYLVVSDAGDGNEQDIVVWRNARFEDGKGKTIPWRDVVDKVETGDGQPLAWGAHPTGGKVADDEVAVRAPAVVKLAVPKGMARFMVECHVDAPAKSASSVQAIVLPEPPDPAEKHYIQQETVFGAKDSAAVRAFDKAQDDILDWDTNSQTYKTPGFAFQDLDGIDIKYFADDPEHWKWQPKHRHGPEPYRIAPTVLRDLASPKRQAEFDTLIRELRLAQQPAHQDLVALLAGQGVKGPEEGVLPAAEVVAKLDDAMRTTYDKLAATITAHEAELERIAREQITAFAERAWRGSVDERDVELLMALYRTERADGGDYEVGVKRALMAVLVAPRFLYRLQRSNDSDEAYPLNARELASRLSFFLWGSLPDAELNALADRDELSDVTVLRAQARRMLRDDRARALATEFAGQWLGFADFDHHSDPDPAAFPEFTDELKRDMHEESVRFFATLFSEDRSILETIHADYAFLNERLAAYYGVGGVEGEKFRRVSVPTDRRGGIFGMGSVLTKTSKPLRTSPVARGAWVIEDVLGIHVPPPPDDVPAISDEPVNADGLNVRQQLELHRRDPACAGCHAKIDPPGVALENYDAIGRWRDKGTDGKPIESATQLSDGETITGLPGLRDYVRTEQDRFVRQFCRKLLGYALGREVLATDEPLLREMITRLESNDYKTGVLIDAIVASKQFRHRRDSAAE